MKRIRTIGLGFAATLLSLSAASCIDQIKLGNAFLEKAPGGTVTEDTIFNSPEYTRRFLDRIYSLQWYGIPGFTRENWGGTEEALTDCYQNHYEKFGGIQAYYNTSLNSLNCDGQYGCQFPYTKSDVWEAVFACNKLLEHINNVPGLDEESKKQMTAEAKCLLAARYYDVFRWYGGVPLIDKVFTGTDVAYELPRSSVEETVNFIVKLLDEAAPDLRWNYSDMDASNDLGHWTKAGAMALKCKVLLLAASPLFNADKPYNSETSATPEEQKAWWYGNYDKARWERCLKACEDFFSALQQNGHYQLIQAEGTKPEDYRLAFRKAYFRQNSIEVLHGVRSGTYDAFKSGWHSHGPAMNGRSYKGTGRNSCPTQEYVEMFGWADGTPFNWDESAAEQNAGKGDKMLDNMFATYTWKKDSKNPQKYNAVAHLTRDPRLYETVLLNGINSSLNWKNAKMSGDFYETWVGGTDALSDAKTEKTGFATGYANNKYWLDEDAYRQYTQWAYLRLSDLYLIYAEALQQVNGDYDKAFQQIDKVRARVGLPGIEVSNPGKNLRTPEAFRDALLRERACELGMEDTRWFDIVRYKLGEQILTKPLHGLRIYRLDDKGNKVETKWRDNKTDQKNNVRMPVHFAYEKFQVTQMQRLWWTNGFDSKWYLTPFPQKEVNKGYGCIQNPGW